MITEAMVMEGNGWPLGLGNMASRITATSDASRPAPPPQTYATRLPRSTSFSSFTSSNLDTESSASFFPDQSVSLGRLIGIRPPTNVGKGSLCSEHRKASDEKSQGLCAPLLRHIILKKGKNGNSSRF